MRYLRTLLRHWALYAIPILLLPVIMTAYGYLTLRTYTSTARLQFQEPGYLPKVGITWDLSKSPAQNVAFVMNDELQSETFLTSVARQTKLAAMPGYNLNTQAGQDAAYARLTKDLSVQAAATAPDLIIISAQDSDRTLAQQIARAFVAGYTAYYQEYRLNADKKTMAFDTEQAEKARSLVAEDARNIAQYELAHPGSADPNAGDAQLLVLNQTLSADQGVLAKFTNDFNGAQLDWQAISAAGSLFTVQDPPNYPLHSSTSMRKLLFDTGIGFGLALALVAGIVAFLTQRDRHVYFAQDLVAIGEALDWDLPVVQHLPLLDGLFVSPKAKKIVGDGDDGGSPPLFGDVAPVGV